MGVQRPPVVHVEVEDAEDQDEHNSRELCLESDHHHDTGDKPENARDNSPEAPVATEDEANEEEDEQDAAGELEVHLLVLFVKRRQARRRKLLANPRVREHHQQAAHDGEIAQEEVEVEDKAVADALEHDNEHEPADRVLGMFPANDHDRAGGHEDYVYQEEEMVDATVDWRGEERLVSSHSGNGRTDAGNIQWR